MRVLLQDLGYAFRQLRKTPGFTVTVLLTLALGIGANSAIFTLVNAILLHNLPVTDPKTLIRIGDKDDCCVNSGWNDEGDYSLFATDTYSMFKKNLPEFEELAAMESGYAWRPITVRRAGPQTVAKSVTGTFVSGNYFRVFGLSPAAGRLFVDADDQKGAPITAVMSYDAWQQDYAGDPSVVGSAFYINTKPATIIGVAPKGFYGDRIDTNPPKYFLPMNSMDGVIGAPYFTDPDTAVGLYHRPRQAGNFPAGAAGQGQRAAEAAVCAAQDIYRSARTEGPSPHPCGAHSRRRRYPEHAGRLQRPPEAAAMDRRAGASGCLRQYRQSAAGARHEPARGAFHPLGTGRAAQPHCAPASYGKRSSLGHGRPARASPSPISERTRCWRSPFPISTTCRSMLRLRRWSSALPLRFRLLPASCLALRRR